MSEHDDTTTGGEAPAEPRRPVLRIVRGDPTPEEVAALLAVLAARSSGSEEPPFPKRSAWAAPERRMRRPVHPAPGGWRASAFPR